MNFVEQSFPGVLAATYLPEDVALALPENSLLPQEQQHFLLYIPWDEKYLNLIPGEFQDFFLSIIQYLRVRTTDVHVAISMQYLDVLINLLPTTCNRRVVALALLLHDSGWSLLTEAEIASSLGVKGLTLNETALAPKEKHAIKSEEIARKVLAEYPFNPPLTSDEIELICKAVLFHDKPEAVAGAAEPMPLEVQALVDLDHLWSFTHENFWQDTVRKGVQPDEYLQNLENDLDTYFVTEQGKQLARELLAQRAIEVEEWGTISPQ